MTDSRAILSRLSKLLRRRSRLRVLQDSVAQLKAQVAELLRLAQETRILVSASGVPMPGNLMLVQTIYGIKYLIDPNDRVMAPQLIVYRQWEEELSRMFLAQLHANSVVVDVGANFGYFTCLAANRIGNTGSGQVFAFEPNPRLLPLLQDNCRINWSMAPVTIHPVAAGAHPGRASLAIPLSSAANASLTTMLGEYETREVDVVTLDQALPENLAIDLLKVDVEGHELAVLQGARAVIARSPALVVVMEWSLDQLRAAGTEPEAMIALFAELGLKAKSVPPSGLLAGARDIPSETLRTLAYDNIVLTRP